MKTPVFADIDPKHGVILGFMAGFTIAAIIAVILFLAAPTRDDLDEPHPDTSPPVSQTR